MRRLMLLSLFLAGCADAPPAPAEVTDPEVDALYTDFLDGKFDAAGHPVGAFVLEGDGCSPETGFALTDGLDAHPLLDAPGLLCQGATDPLGRGLHTVNVRAARTAACDTDCDAPALAVRVLDDAGAELDARSIAPADFARTGEYQNHPLRLTVRSAGPVRVEVEYLGEHAVRLEYVEVFRTDRQLVLGPTSGVPDPDAVFRAELVDPPEDAELRLRCGELDRTDALSAQIDAGEGTVEDTEFRRIVTAPLAPLLDGCARPARLVAELRRPDRVYTTSEVYYLDAPIACPEDDGRPLVLLTGFLPFPAGSSHDNSSQQAVLGFDAEAVPGARVLKIALPVEFDTAAAIVADVSERCAPDVVVGFGQGRWRVDLETTAYNSKDTSDVAGGVPDNRGRVLDGEAIRTDGPPELPTRLPVEAILTDLDAGDVSASTSDDPGRYICNDLFYSLAHDAPPERVVGFVHLPILRRVDDDDRAMLQTVVESVVRRSIEAL